MTKDGMAPVAQLDLWRGASLSGAVRGQATATVQGIIRVADTGCKPLLMPASDGFVYWVKPQHNPHGQLSLLTERVVAAVAQFLGAPIANSTLVTIPETMHGTSYSSNAEFLYAGTAHASRVIKGELHEERELRYVPKDGNRYRAPAFIALWEWCFGDDGQWIYNLEDDFQMWTFDHGTWIGGQGQWGIDDLAGSERLSSGWPGSVKGMDAGTFLGLADKIETCSVADVLEFVSTVPIDWGFTDEELIKVAKWLHARRRHVAQNLKRHSKCV